MPCAWFNFFVRLWSLCTFFQSYDWEVFNQNMRDVFLASKRAASLLWVRTVPFVLNAYSSLCSECVQFPTVSLQSPPCSECVQFPLSRVRTVPFVLSAYSSLQFPYSRLLALSTYSSLCPECVQFPLFWVRIVPYSYLTVASLSECVQLKTTPLECHFVKQQFKFYTLFLCTERTHLPQTQTACRCWLPMTRALDWRLLHKKWSSATRTKQMVLTAMPWSTPTCNSAQRARMSLLCWFHPVQETRE